MHTAYPATRLSLESYRPTGVQRVLVDYYGTGSVYVTLLAEQLYQHLITITRYRVQYKYSALHRHWYRYLVLYLVYGAEMKNFGDVRSFKGQRKLLSNGNIVLLYSHG